MARKPKGKKAPSTARGKRKPRATNAGNVVRVSQRVVLATGEAASSHPGPPIHIQAQPYNPFPMWSSTEMPRRAPDPLVNVPPVIPQPFVSLVPQPVSDGGLSAVQPPGHVQSDIIREARAAPPTPAREKAFSRMSATREELVAKARARGLPVGRKDSAARIRYRLMQEEASRLQ